MASDLSPQTEQYLQQVVAGGIYPSKEAAIDAAVAALREKYADLPLIPESHSAAVEQAIASSEAGRSRPFTDEDWTRLRKLAVDFASDKD